MLGIQNSSFTASKITANKSLARTKFSNQVVFGTNPTEGSRMITHLTEPSELTPAIKAGIKRWS